MAARVLVVDDSKFTRDLLRLHLEEAGYEVSLADDAISAGYSIIKSAPDVVLCDVQMPHMDGFELFANVLSDSSLPDVPFVFLSSRDDGFTRAKNLGALDYLVKPVSKDRLLAAVEGALLKVGKTSS